MSQTSNAKIEQLFTRQQKGFAADRMPSLETRTDRLRELERMMIAFREPMRDALNDDFAAHNPLVTDLFEGGAIIARSRYVQAHLEEWMSPSPRALEPLVHGSSTACVVRQPKGVVGNISPWNFPVECALVMVVDMLAAGNRVMIKTSELAPATADVVQEMVAAHFNPDVLVAVGGGVETAEYFASLPWDHLCYTGSTRVGRLVAAAAAKNLVPVTLEMGGKNPTIFAKDGFEDELIERWLYFRVFKGGQVCTSPDYALVPKGREREWTEAAKRSWTKLYPDGYVGHADATGAINEAHYTRVTGYVEEARQAGVDVVSLNGDEPDPETREIPMYALVDPPERLQAMQDETFGPVTCVKGYEDLDDAIAYVNARSRPLAAYLVTRDDEVIDRVSSEVHSGGLGVNVFGFQAADPALPFGGTGPSGVGCHGGFEGFLTFTHSKSVYRCADDDPLMLAIRPPYGAMTQAFADATFTPAEEIAASAS